MNPIPLYVVRHFKGEDTRLLSKHLNHDAAFQVANRYINNLRRKHNTDTDAEVLVSINQISGSMGKPTILALTNRQFGPTGEGVRIDQEYKRDPNWDYPQHTEPCESDSGQRTTAGRRHL